MEDELKKFYLFLIRNGSIRHLGNDEQRLMAADDAYRKYTEQQQDNQS